MFSNFFFKFCFPIPFSNFVLKFCFKIFLQVIAVKEQCLNFSNDSMLFLIIFCHSILAISFLDVSTHLYMRVRLSVRRSRVFFESRKLIRNSIESLEKLRHCSLTAITCKKLLKQNFETKF